MKIRFYGGHAEEVWEFLQTFNYPYPWMKDELAQSIVLAVLTDDDTHVGYVWGHFDPKLRPPHKVLAFNACIRPEFRSRWLARRLIVDLFTIARITGAEYLYTKPINDIVRNYLERLGFKPDGAWMRTEI